MRTGIVRPSVQGEHPTLGVLTPCAIMEVPDDLWSDALFLPITEEGHIDIAQPKNEDLADRILAELQTSQSLLPRLAAVHDQMKTNASLSRQLTDRIDHIRPLLRSLAALRGEMEAFTLEAEGRCAQYSQQIDALTCDIAQVIDTHIRPCLNEAQAALADQSPSSISPEAQTDVGHETADPAPTKSNAIVEPARPTIDS